MAEIPDEFTVRFGKIARTIEYDDAQGHLGFAVDRGAGGGKSLVLEHYEPRKQTVPRYAIAFERTKRFLESRGYQVEVYGTLASPNRVAASDIAALIQKELVGLSRPLKSHLDLGKCLILPASTTFQSYPGSDSWDLWLVLEERPETKDGYKMVFDEYSKQFGVARGGEFIGFEGTFIQTLEAISGVA
jgi:hypothetical protein